MPGKTGRYRLIDSTGRELARADTIPYFKGFVVDLEPGRYTIQEVQADPDGNAHNIVRWGGILRFEDGSVVLKPDVGNEVDEDEDEA